MQFALFKTVQEMERLFLFTGANILFSSTSTLLIFLKEAFLFKGLLKFVEKFIIVSHYMNIEINWFKKKTNTLGKTFHHFAYTTFLKKNIQDVFKSLKIYGFFFLVYVNVVYENISLIIIPVADASDNFSEQLLLSSEILKI